MIIKYASQCLDGIHTQTRSRNLLSRNIKILLENLFLYFVKKRMIYTLFAFPQKELLTHLCLVLIDRFSDYFAFCVTPCHAMWQNKIIKWVPEFLRSKHSEPSLNIFVWCLFVKADTRYLCPVLCILPYSPPFFVPHIIWMTLETWHLSHCCPGQHKAIVRHIGVNSDGGTFFINTLIPSYNHTHTHTRFMTQMIIFSLNKSEILETHWVNEA